jgi:hypothetical protein
LLRTRQILCSTLEVSSTISVRNSIDEEPKGEKENGPDCDDHDPPIYSVDKTTERNNSLLRFDVNLVSIVRCEYLVAEDYR